MPTEDTLKKSQELENQIRALGGQMTPEQQKQLLQKMLEIRIEELMTEGLSKTAAIEQTCKEFSMDFQEKKTDTEQAQFDLLAKIKTVLLQRVPEQEVTSEEDRKKKLEKQEKEQEPEKQGKSTVNVPRWIADTYPSYYLAGSVIEKYQATTLADALRNAPKNATIFMHVNTHNVTFGWREGPPKEFGKNGNQTTLDYDGLRLTGYDYGMHGEACLEISSDATAEQKTRFLKAAGEADKAIGEQRNRGYGLLDANCQKARTTLAHAVDPTMQVCSMPWNANAEFEKKCEQQKVGRPALADGARTNALSETLAAMPAAGPGPVAI